MRLQVEAAKEAKAATCLASVTPALIVKLAQSASHADNQQHQRVNWKFPLQFLCEYICIGFFSFLSLRVVHISFLYPFALLRAHKQQKSLLCCSQSGRIVVIQHTHIHTCWGRSWVPSERRSQERWCKACCGILLKCHFTLASANLWYLWIKNISLFTRKLYNI